VRSTATLPHLVLCSPRCVTQEPFNGPRTPQSGLDRHRRDPGEGAEGSCMRKMLYDTMWLGGRKMKWEGVRGASTPSAAPPLRLEGAPGR
jgi:hypothetical protein